MITRELLKLILTEQRADILKKPIGIKRNALQKVRNKIHLPHILVISGLRRCGKSVFMRQIIKEFYNDSDFYYINFEDERLLNFDATAFNMVYETLVELFGTKRTFFIDEIQHVKNFDAFVRRFYDNGFRFFITGSNANFLKEEVSTRLTGRHLDIWLKSFSFDEYLLLKTGKSINPNQFYLTEEIAVVKKWFATYLERGGMPEYSIYEEDEILRRTYDDIISKDIIIRRQPENPVAARELYLFLISNFARKFSYNSLGKVVTIGSINTIKKYSSYLEETFLGQIIPKFDFSMKKQFANDKKFYVGDNGFIRIISTQPSIDKGWLLENLVMINLDTESDVFYFSNKREVDFITVKNKSVQQVLQVCWELNPLNRKRELEGLLEALTVMGLDRGMILTGDQEEEIKTGSLTIEVKPVWKWLLQEK